MSAYTFCRKMKHDRAKNNYNMRSDYVPLACLYRGETNKASYIDTGLRLDPNATYEVKFACYMTRTNSIPIFGGGYSKTDTTFCIWVSSTGYSASFGKAQADSETGYVGNVDTLKYHVIRAECATRRLYIDGVLAGTSSTSYFDNLTTKEYKMVLFGNWRQTSNSTKPDRSGEGIMAWFRAWSGNTLVRDMIPARARTGEYGLYDRCHSGPIFYKFDMEEQNTGYRTRMDMDYENDYRIVRYIENYSGGYRIDTGLNTKTNPFHAIEVDYYAPDCDDDIPLFGISNVDGEKFGFAYYAKYNGDNMCVLFGDETYVVPGARLGRHKVRIDPIENVVTIDGEVILSLGGASTTQTGWDYINIFGFSASMERCPAGIRIYSVRQIRHNSTIYYCNWDIITSVLLIPVVQKSTGIPGFLRYHSKTRDFVYMTYSPHDGCKPGIK